MLEFHDKLNRAVVMREKSDQIVARLLHAHEQSLAYGINVWLWNLDLDNSSSHLLSFLYQPVNLLSSSLL
jgi:hypothetical protein